MPDSKVSDSLNPNSVNIFDESIAYLKSCPGLSGINSIQLSKSSQAYYFIAKTIF